MKKKRSTFLAVLNWFRSVLKSIAYFLSLGLVIWMMEKTLKYLHNGCFILLDIRTQDDECKWGHKLSLTLSAREANIFGPTLAAVSVFSPVSLLWKIDQQSSPPPRVYSRCVSWVSDVALESWGPSPTEPARHGQLVDPPARQTAGCPGPLRHCSEVSVSVPLTAWRDLQLCQPENWQSQSLLTAHQGARRPQKEKRKNFSSNWLLNNREIKETDLNYSIIFQNKHSKCK